MNNAQLLAKQAITAGLNNQQDNAIEINKQILKANPNDLAAINRLGKCYSCIKKFQLAKKYYQQALKIDPYNLIAKRNLKLLSKSKPNNTTTPGASTNVCYEFLEIPGKTQSISLIKIAGADKLCELITGEEVSLHCQTRSIRVYCQNNYIGCLPDNISIKLIHLITSGNKYSGHVKSISKEKIVVFVKEVYQSQANKDSTSFTHGKKDDEYETTISQHLFS